MKRFEPQSPSPAVPAEPSASGRPVYEPPRILSRRAVERVTLSFNEPVTPGGGIGEQP